MYSSIWQILTSLSANFKWPSHIIVPVWWTVLVSSKAEKSRRGRRTRAPLQAFSGPRKGKQQLTLLTFLDSIICFFTKSYITGKTTGPCCRANQNRRHFPNSHWQQVPSVDCFCFSALAVLWHKTSQSRLFKRTKNAGVVVGNIGKIDSPCQPPCSRGLGGKTYVSECWTMSNNKNTVVEGQSKTLY